MDGVTVGGLDGRCMARFGHWDRDSWHDILGRFLDANLYQTWAYDRARYRQRDVVHMVLTRDGVLAAAAQARLVRVPGARAGIAYIRWGPMWQPDGCARDPEVFRVAVRALRNEFSHRRGLVLRIYPLAYREDDEVLHEILEAEGYQLHPSGANERTLIMDLAAPLEVLRAALDQKWRNCLNRAEKNGIELVSGTDERLFDEIETMYGEMAVRKGLGQASDISHLKKVQAELPEAFKLRVILCRHDGKPCAGAIFGAVGKTGLYIRGATSEAGLRTNGSYLVQWAFVRWLNERGLVAYDLNGISPDANPGTYHFKRGLAGKRARDVHLLGQYQIADSPLSAWIVRGGESLQSTFRRVVASARTLRGKRAG